MKALYLCYQSIQEPLTRTQVVPYLEGLAAAGHTMRLITFEPTGLSAATAESMRGQLAATGISWNWLRYHKRPTLPATTFDILVGAWVGLRTTRKHDIRLIHARGQVAGVMGLLIKAFSGAKLLFDMRGLLAEEYADAGVWRRGGFLFTLANRAERMLVRNSDGIVVLTNRATDLIRARDLGSDGAVVEVIPCCVDLRSYEVTARARVTEQPDLVLVYTGKLGGWYWDEAMVRFFAAMQRIAPRTRLRVYTQSDPASLTALLQRHAVSEWTTVQRVAPSELPDALQAADVGLSFIRPSLSKMASSPTKIGEYLAAGLPVVSTAGIGDVDDILAGTHNRPLGVIVRDETDAAYEKAARELIALLRTDGLKDRCRQAARQLLDLESVGWPRYRRLYERLA